MTDHEVPQAVLPIADRNQHLDARRDEQLVEVVDFTREDVEIAAARWLSGIRGLFVDQVHFQFVSHQTHIERRLPKDEI